MKVLHITESAKGGVASYLNIIVNAQSEKYGDGNVFVAAPNQHAEQLHIPTGVKFVGFNASSNRILSAIRVAYIAWELVRAHNIKIVHIHSTFGGAVSRPILTLLTKVKIVYCPHGWAWDRYSAGWIKFIIRKLEWTLSCFSDKVICISEYELKEALSAGISLDKLERISNAIENTPPVSERILVDWNSEKKRVLYVGRFDRQKGADLFIRAIKMLPLEYSAIMIGEHVVDINCDLEDVPERIQKVGWLNAAQLEYFYQTADCLVMPSRWEGFGLVALEAMRAGCVVIASNIGGLAEVISHEVTGILIEPECEVSIVKAIQGLTTENSEKMRMAAKCRVGTLFNSDILNKKIFSMYERLTNQISVEI